MTQFQNNPTLDKILDPAMKLQDIFKYLMDYHQESADRLLCAITLYGAGLVDKTATVQEFNEYFVAIEQKGDDCTVCPCNQFCPLSRYYE